MIAKKLNTTGQDKRDYLVVSKRSRLRRLIEMLGTVSLWLYALAVIAFFGTAFLKINPLRLRLVKSALKITNVQITLFVLKAVLIFVIIMGLLCLWKYYNRRRYGKLCRRRYPHPTTQDDLRTLGLVDEEKFRKLQESKYIVFEKNPIRDIE
ncbi:MAG: poly-beta-1,6-N-acetyl-D-glucosamine biosynthesis protein PgaD [Cellulosilyticaceae bacterium]